MAEKSLALQYLERGFTDIKLFEMFNIDVGGVYQATANRLRKQASRPLNKGKREELLRQAEQAERQALKHMGCDLWHFRVDGEFQNEQARKYAERKADAMKQTKNGTGVDSPERLARVQQLADYYGDKPDHDGDGDDCPLSFFELPPEQQEFPHKAGKGGR